MVTQSREFRTAFAAAVGSWELDVPASALCQMEAHFDLMVEANRSVNLTRITDPVESAVKHYADSVAILPWVRDRKIKVTSVIDVGTGAGFPAVPLAILRPDWKITAIDGTAKKITFLENTITSVGLTNLNVVHAHSTHWVGARAADLVLARAVGRLSKCMLQTASHINSGGHLVTYKTPLKETDVEHIEARTTCAEHRFVMAPPFYYDLPLRDEVLSRALYAFKRKG